MLKKLLLSIFLSFLTFNVCYAEDISFLGEGNLEISYHLGGIVFDGTEVEEEEFSVYMLVSSGTLSVEEYIRQQLYNHVESIDLSGYRITIAELSSILASNRDFIVASGYINYGYYNNPVNSVNERIVAFYNPYYLFDTKEEDAAARKLIDEGIKKYVDEIEPKTDDLLGRLLLLHDNLIEDCEYDEDKKIESYSLYSVFAKREMVCQGYAQAMYFIGRELGLDMEFCSSHAIGHIWNYAKIDDEYYHVDATWDDPILIGQYPMLDENGDVVVDENGDPIILEKRVHRTTAIHDNFLKCDETMQIEDTDHGKNSDWRTSMKAIPVCNSTKYENNYFFNITRDFTTSINNGNYEAIAYIQTYTGSKENKIFYADELYTGPVITSYPEETDTFYFVYYLMTSNINEFNVFVKAHNSEEFVYVKKYEKTSYPKNTLTGQKIFKSDLPQGKEQISMYLWDMENLKPLSRVIPIK